MYKSPCQLNHEIDYLQDQLHLQYEADSKHLLASIQKQFGPTVYLMAICYKNYDLDFNKYNELQVKFGADKFESYEDLDEAFYSEDLNQKINACLIALESHKRLRDEYFPPFVKR